ARTGARRGELMALRWSDIDWGRSTLTIRRALAQVPGLGVRVKATKTEQERTITLDPVTIGALDQHRRRLAKRSARAGGQLVADGPMFADLAADPNGTVPRKPDWLS